MIIDCIADLHGHYPKLDGGDLLIIAGDLTARDTEKCWIDFETWICAQDYKEKIIIAGNHDNFLTTMPKHNIWKYWDKVGITYLCDSGTEFTYYPPIKKDCEEVLERKKFKIWGSPWTKTFPGMNPKCKAFTLDSEEELAEKWALIPKDTNILVTHGPPFGLFDHTDWGHHGSRSLDDRIFYMPDLELHVFGHIHECGGKKQRTPKYDDKYISVNCSHVNENYEPVNKPIRIIL